MMVVDKTQNDNNNFSQRAMVSLIFPFLSIDTNIKCIKEVLIKKGFVRDEQFIDDDSRHFDYIEQIFLHKENEILGNKRKKIIDEKVKNFVFLINKNNSNFDIIFRAKNESNIKIDNFFSIENIKFILFETGIFFLVIKYKSHIIHEYEEYFDYILKLRDYYKKTKILDFVVNISEINENQIETFDMDKEQGTTRFQLFSEIVLGQNENNVYKHSKNDYEYVNEDQCNVIANYFLNRNSVKRYRIYSSEKISNISAFYGNKIFCTDEGVLSLTTKYSNNIKLYEKTYQGKNEPFIQNVFYTYIIILHQYYFLHHLKKKIKELDIYDKKIKKSLITIKEEFVLFQTNYLYKKVSQFYYQEKIYQLIFNSLSIDNFVKEISDSTKPLDDILKEKRNEKLDLIVKLFTVITITNAFCSLSGAYYAFFAENKINKFLIVGIPTIFIFLSYIFLICFCKNNIKK